MSILSIIILAIVQGAAELLPVSSSAHVIVTARLLGHDVASPEFTFLLVMLHTGTMGAVIIYFFSRWKALLGGEKAERNAFLKNALIATVVTGGVGLLLKHAIEVYFLPGGDKAQIEDLFRNQKLIATSLFGVGVLIIYSGWRAERMKAQMPLSYSGSFVTGFIQGLCLPFRGFSRSGATISTGLILGFSRQLAEEFSFALAVILTPPVIARELWRLIKAPGGDGHLHISASMFVPGLGGMVLSFFSGWLALRFLSSWLEKGRWAFFGFYCLAFSAVVLLLEHIKN
jgi:undecaprenyl-diphosphatase